MTKELTMKLAMDVAKMTKEAIDGFEFEGEGVSVALNALIGCAASIIAAYADNAEQAELSTQVFHQKTQKLVRELVEKKVAQ